MDELITESTKAAATLETVAGALDHLDQPNQAAECRKRAEEIRNARGDRCEVCGGSLDRETDFDKFDPRNPVVGDDLDYHLGCEGDVFETVYAEA